MKLDTLVVGPYGVNCYVVSAEDSASCVVVDPGGDSDTIQSCLDARGQTLEAVLLTHSHFDHAIAIPDLLAHWEDAGLACHTICGQCIGDPRTNLSPAVVGEAVRLSAPEYPLEDGATLDVAGLQFAACHVPGHAPGHLAYYVKEEDCLFSGDLVLMGSIGRTDLPGG